MKSWFCVLMALSCVVSFCGCRSESCGAVDVSEGSPAYVTQQVMSLIATGRIGYAADLYMGPNASWGGQTRDELVAAENVLHATKIKDLKMIFEQAPFLRDAQLTPEASKKLIDALPTLDESRKNEILAKCEVKRAESERIFQAFVGTKVVQTIPIGDSTAACIVIGTDPAGKNFSLTTLLCNKTGSWLIYGMISNELWY